MGLLSTHEAIVWREFHHGLSTGAIAEASQDPYWLYEHGLMNDIEKTKAIDAIKEIEDRLTRARNSSEKRQYERRRERLVHEWAWSPAYVSRVLSRARKKIKKTLREHAASHRLDVESVLDYKGLLIGFDYQANTQVFIVFTLSHGIIIWYKHDSYAGKLCHECPKESACQETLDVIIKEYNLGLRDDEMSLPMTKRSIVIFHKLAAKEVPRYKRKESD
ncbi:MAG: hypothetical protein K9W43_08995 [Candidatus Thorarchaeota archaeon]|nr:hypothetical protein [Candidatus Thorarchaeota archaeon]